MSDEAKAVEALAKLGERSLETADKAGGWATRVFGEGFQQLGGTWADSMAGYRFRNRVRVLQKTQAAIEKAGLTDDIRTLSDRLALPLLEAISDESDETLQDVWAAYIRNAVDPTKSNGDRLLIDVIRRLEPRDWPILQTLFLSGNVTLGPSEFGLLEDELGEILDRLTALGLLDFDDDQSVYLIAEGSSPPALKIRCGGGDYYAMKLLRRFQDAVARD
ncbi:hypothetical protein N0B44_25420 [Roseibacterium beibuensis]|uniref:Abi-alpha family protein n=1 Tax=[Roseibacterium] beibuensis TaxID=1193142 RepID=UPI00217EABA5|nr:hypothetical protein [Roseibacterium beibuensis]MCS6626264.1 hypothetical protein [Roseibacterium beibuensis]